jgi:DNA transformation protein
MPASKKEKEFVSYVVELMQSIGPVYAKGMFGGHGIYLDGLMFALIADSVLYLKIDEDTEDLFKDKGLEAFTYIKKGKACKMSYYQAPEETLEDNEQMSAWANRAYTAALKAASKKRKK